MHTAPLALALSLVGFWLALGWAAQVLLRLQLGNLSSLLLSPLIGFTVQLVPVFWFSMVGLPVGSFARPLTIVLAAGAIGAWVIRRPEWTRTHLLALAIIILAVVASGLPTLMFGFDWVANANDDWANYNLGAVRLVDHAMLDRPDIRAMEDGKDYPGYLYFLTVAHDTRPGSELMLAWLGALTRQSPFLIFMPLILGFEAVMLCAAAALALLGARTRQHWFFGLLLTAAAPLSLYAIQQQLIAQFIGIAFTCGMTALTCTRLWELAGWRRLALVMILGCGYLLCYPEMSPFFGLTVLVFHLAHARDRNWGWSRFWRLLIVPGGLAICLGPYLLSAALFLLHQFTHSAAQGRFGGISIFPYFLVPSGAAMLWGFLPFGSFPPEPWLSASIVVGLALVVFTLFAAVLRLGAGSVMAGMLIIFSLAAAQLAWKDNDFGLFKITMFVQPFLWFTVLGAIPGRRYLPALVAGGLGAATLFTDYQMTTAALKDASGGGIGIAGASRDHLLHSILEHSDPDWCDVDFETANLPLVKILSARTGCARVYSARFAGIFTVFDTDDYLGYNPLHRIFGIDDFVRLAAKSLSFVPKLQPIGFKGLDGSTVEGRYFNLGINGLPKISIAPSVENVLNLEHPGLLSVRQKDQVGEHLEFIESSFGDDFYIPYFSTTGMYATEPDPFVPGRLIEAVGRYMLFKVVSPSPEVRLSIDISTTLIPGGPRHLPPARVMGETSASFNLTGNGSARVLSPPVKPLIIGKETYILLDLGEDARQLQRPRTGAMGLYGSDYSVDYRVVTAFARRITVVDAAHCDCEVAPSGIIDLKTALTDPTLQYSGIYEDSWIGQDGFARLADDKPGKAEFSFMIPRGIGAAHGRVTLSVEDGQSVTRSLALGTFIVRVPVEPGPHRISWHFSDAGILPDGDGRSAAAMLRSFAIVPDAGDGSRTSTAEDADLADTLGDPTLPYSGVEADGWVSQDGFMSFRADAPGRIDLHLMVPGGIGIAKDDVTFTVDGGDKTTQALALGDSIVALPVTAGTHKIDWHFGTTGVLPNGDGRSVAALLKSISLDHEGRAAQDAQSRP